MPKKKMTTETLEELQRDIQGTLRNVVLNADAFIFRGEPSAYEPVSVHLRKLLLDGNAPRSYDKETTHPNLLALIYGGIGGIIVNGDPPHQRRRDEVGREWFPVTPDLYASPTDIIRAAYVSVQELHLAEWLNGYVAGCYATGCRCPGGKKRSKKVSEVIRVFADKEGAHKLNYDEDRDAAIAVTPSGSTHHVTKLNYDLPWQQFIIMAGLKLVFAKHVVRGVGLIPVLDMAWFESSYPHWYPFMVPTTEGPGSMRLETCAHDG